MNEHPSTRQPGPGRHRLRRFRDGHAGQWLRVPVPLGLVLAAVLGSLPVIVAIVGVATPRQHWTRQVMAAVTLGWAAPLATVAALTIVAVARERLAARRALRAHVLSVALLASRTQYYLDGGHPDPLRAATFDFASHALRRGASASTASWRSAARQWFRDHAGDTGLPPPEDGD